MEGRASARVTARVWQLPPPGPSSLGHCPHCCPWAARVSSPCSPGSLGLVSTGVQRLLGNVGLSPGGSPVVVSTWEAGAGPASRELPFNLIGDVVGESFLELLETIHFASQHCEYSANLASSLLATNSRTFVINSTGSSRDPCSAL